MSTTNELIQIVCRVELPGIPVSTEALRSLLEVREKVFGAKLDHDKIRLRDIERLVEVLRGKLIIEIGTEKYYICLAAELVFSHSDISQVSSPALLEKLKISGSSESEITCFLGLHQLPCIDSLAGLLKIESSSSPLRKR